MAIGAIEMTSFSCFHHAPSLNLALCFRCFRWYQSEAWWTKVEITIVWLKKNNTLQQSEQMILNFTFYWWFFKTLSRDPPAANGEVFTTTKHYIRINDAPNYGHDAAIVASIIGQSFTFQNIPHLKPKSDIKMQGSPSFLEVRRPG